MIRLNPLPPLGTVLFLLFACGTAPAARQSSSAASLSADLALASPTSLVPISGSASETITGAVFSPTLVSWADAVAGAPPGMRLAGVDEASALATAGLLSGLATSTLPDVWTATDDNGGADAWVIATSDGRLVLEEKLQALSMRYPFLLALLLAGCGTIEVPATSVATETSTATTTSTAVGTDSAASTETVTAGPGYSATRSRHRRALR
jgi:hypothetical protein